MTNRIDIIRSEIQNDPEGLGYAALGQNYPAIADAMNARPMIDNPVTEAPQVPAKPSLAQLFGAELQADQVGTLAAIEKFGNLLDMASAAIDKGDTQSIMAHIAIFGSTMNANGKAALAAAVSATQPDPTWTAQIPGDSRATVLGVAPVRATDVQEAMN